MILADTNIFIDFWNAPQKRLADVFEKEEICICGVVRAELLHGAVSERDFANITTVLKMFNELYFDTADWQELGKNLYLLRKKGVSVPFPDAIIATVALKYKIPIWSGDSHFRLIQNALPELKLYQPS